MPTVADVLRQYGPEYLERFGATMPAEHKKVLNTIMACRTGELGMVFYECTSCGRTHAMGRSCGNRHCPSCQQDKTKAWLEAQTDRLLPCPYFLLTFTVPAGLRGWIRSHQRIAYPALFEASSQAITTLMADPKHVGATTTGFFGVLAQVDPAVWHQDWVVHSQSVGDGRASLKYLAPYVFRVAISDRRIVSNDGGKVTYSYRKSGSNRWRKMTVEGPEFVRRFLQHVLPTGFQKVRHYGFLSPNSRVSLELVRWLIALYQGLVFALWSPPRREVPIRPRIRCAACGEPMVVVGFVPYTKRVLFDTS
jgi:ribosomal protein S14